MPRACKSPQISLPSKGRLCTEYFLLVRVAAQVLRFNPATQIYLVLPTSEPEAASRVTTL